MNENKFKRTSMEEVIGKLAVGFKFGKGVKAKSANELSNIDKRKSDITKEFYKLIYNPKISHEERRNVILDYATAISKIDIKSIGYKSDEIQYSDRKELGEDDDGGVTLGFMCDITLLSSKEKHEIGNPSKDFFVWINSDVFAAEAEKMIGKEKNEFKKKILAMQIAITASHETIHYFQHKDIQKKPQSEYDFPDERRYQILKEMIAHELAGNSYYMVGENYLNQLFEVQARQKGIKKNLNMFQEAYGTSAVETYLINKLDNISEDKYRGLKQMDFEGMKFDKEALTSYLTDEMVAVNPKLLEKYPLLKMEYNVDGSRKSVMQLYVEHNNKLLKLEKCEKDGKIKPNIKGKAEASLNSIYFNAFVQNIRLCKDYNDDPQNEYVKWMEISKIALGSATFDQYLNKAMKFFGRDYKEYNEKRVDNDVKLRSEILKQDRSDFEKITNKHRKIINEKCDRLKSILYGYKMQTYGEEEYPGKSGKAIMESIKRIKLYAQNNLENETYKKVVPKISLYLKRKKSNKKNSKASNIDLDEIKEFAEETNKVLHSEVEKNERYKNRKMMLNNMTDRGIYNKKTDSGDYEQYR